MHTVCTGNCGIQKQRNQTVNFFLFFGFVQNHLIHKKFKAQECHLGLNMYLPTRILHFVKATIPGTHRRRFVGVIQPPTYFLNKALKRAIQPKYIAFLLVSKWFVQKLQKCISTDAIFLFRLKTNSFQAKYKVYGTITNKLIPSWRALNKLGPITYWFGDT